MVALASAIRAGALPSWEKSNLRSNPGSRQYSAAQPHHALPT